MLERDLSRWLIYLLINKLNGICINLSYQGFKNFINYRKKLLHLLNLKSISEKQLLQIANKKHVLDT